MQKYEKKNFYFLTLGQFVSLIGDKISLAVFISIAVAIIGTTESTYNSSFLIATLYAPLFLFGYLFGLLADKKKKKELMILSDILRATLILSLLFFNDSLLYLYCCVFLIGVLTSMFEPCKKSIMPFLVPKEKIIFYNKIYASLEIIALLVGFLFGTYLIEAFSLSVALIFDASTYLFSALLLVFIKYTQETITKKKKEKPTTLKELKEGIHYIKNSIELKVILIGIVFFHFFASAFFVSSSTDFSIRISQSIGMSPGSSFSFLLFFIATGALVSPVIKKLSQSIRESTLTKFIYLFGSITLFLFVFSLKNFENNYYTALFFHFIIGIFAGLQYIRYIYLIQTNTQKRYLGRVVSVSDLIFALGAILGLGLGAIINETLTYNSGFLITGVIYFIAYLYMVFSTRKYKLNF